MKKLQSNTPLLLLIVAILPLSYLVFSLAFKAQIGPSSLIAGDPEYLYLYNGMSLGRLVFDIGHIDNPGTPLQIVFALTSRVVHLFSGEYDYAKDVLAHPDFYLNWFHRVNILLFSVTLLLLGISVFRKTGNMITTIFLQLVPFSSLTITANSLRILPEMYTIIPLSFVIYFFIKYIYQNSEFTKSESKHMVILALIAGFGLSIKLNYLPFIFLPIFIFSNIHLILKYFAITFLSFFLFAFPILWKLNTWWHWVKQLLFRSGVHGTGKETFFDFSVMLPNLKILIANFTVNYLLLSLAILLLIVLIIKRIKGSKSVTFDLLSGVVLAFVLQTFMIIKSFTMHYYIPALFMTCFIIVLIVEIIGFHKILKQLLLFITGTAIIITFVVEFNKYKNWKLPAIHIKSVVRNEVKPIVDGKPFIIFQQPYNFHFEEPPLLFGWFFNTPKSREYCRNILMELYPDTYIYDISKNAFFLWGELLKKEQFITNYKELYVFVDSRRLPDFEKSLLENSNYQKVEIVYDNETTRDKVYLLQNK